MSVGKANDLHAQAINVREHEQDFLKALKFTDEAILACVEEKDSKELIGIFGTRQNIFGHLAEKTEDNNYLILAKHAAMAAVEIAEKSNLPSSMPYRDLAKAHEKLKDYKEAISYYEKSLNSSLDENHNRESIKADIKAHFAYVKYKNGDKSALDLMNEAISQLESAAEQQYEKDVWLSGAHMRAAEMLKEDNPQLSKDHLAKAQEIIDGNSELVLRKGQLEELQKLI